MPLADVRSAQLLSVRLEISHCRCLTSSECVFHSKVDNWHTLLKRRRRLPVPGFEMAWVFAKLLIPLLDDDVGTLDLCYLLSVGVVSCMTSARNLLRLR